MGLYDPEYNTYDDEDYGPGWMREHDDTVEGIPLYDEISGAAARRERRRQEREASRNRAYWETLAAGAPSEDDLSVEYGNEDFVDGGPSAWAAESERRAAGAGGIGDALSAFREWSRGGLTDTDRAMMDEASRNEGMRARADREAAMSAMEARGMGGSGAELMARMGADEAAHSRALGMHTDMLAAAQQRQLDATRAMAETGRMGADLDDRRTSALESYRNREADYARGLEERNTGHENRTRESAADAAQRAYENRERATAGVTNQYSTDVAARRAAREDEEDSNESIMRIIGAATTYGASEA